MAYRLILDENVEHEVFHRLENYSHDVEHVDFVPELGKGTSDRPIAKYSLDTNQVIIGYETGQIVDRFGDAFAGVPITYVHQRERLGLGHAVLQAEPHVDGTRREAGRPAVDARHGGVSRVA